MAKQASTETTTAAAGPRFVVTHPLAGFAGTECCTTFVAGKAATNDPTMAHALLQNGCVVTDHGKPAFGSDDPESIKRIEAVAAGRRAAGR